MCLFSYKILTTLDLSKILTLNRSFSATHETINMTCPLDIMYFTVTLQGTNISPSKVAVKMIFLFHRWDMLVPRRVHFIFHRLVISPPPFMLECRLPVGTQWERCLDLFQGSAAAVSFAGWRGYQLKIFEGWLHNVGILAHLVRV